MSGEQLRRRFARLVTSAVVRMPRLWRVFRGPMRRSFDGIAGQWNEIRAANPQHLAAFEAALAEVDPPPRRVLDLGTGTGAAAVALARRFPQAEIVGVDLSPAMVEEARRLAPPDLATRVSFGVGDASRLEYPDGAFELVALANMIPFFDEVTRLVAPGGWALFSFSRGAATPIYVPFERIERELRRRGFTHFAGFSAGQATGLLARRNAAGGY